MKTSTLLTGRKASLVKVVQVEDCLYFVTLEGLSPLWLMCRYRDVCGGSRDQCRSKDPSCGSTADGSADLRTLRRWPAGGARSVDGRLYTHTHNTVWTSCHWSRHWRRDVTLEMWRHLGGVTSPWRCDVTLEAWRSPSPHRVSFNDKRPLAFKMTERRIYPGRASGVTHWK
jgi:hypothetical protein